MQDKEQQKIFEDAVTEYGGSLLNPSKSENSDNFRFKWNIYSYRNFLRLLKPYPLIIAGLVNNDNYNAFAKIDKISGQRIIGLFSGVRKILNDIFLRIM